MASVHKKADSRYYFAFYKDRSGKLVSKSTKELNKRAAQRIADLYEAATLRKKSAQHIKAAFAEIFKQTYGESMPVATAREFSAAWLAQKKHETAPSSFAAYRKTAGTFLEYLGDRADRDLGDIARKDVLGFRNQLTERVSSVTANRYLKILRMLFKAAHRDGYLMENPAEYVEVLKKRDHARRRPFSIPEIKAVLAIADPEWKSLIKFGLYTGQRLADISLLTWSNIDLERDEIRLVTRKTGKRLAIPIAGPLRAHLDSLSNSDDPNAALHPRAFEAIRRTGRAALVSNWFVELLTEAGLREKHNHQSRGIGRNAKRTGNDLSFHCLRHTAVSLLKDAGIPQAAVQAMIGHDSEQMSALYTHVGREALERAAAALPEI